MILIPLSQSGPQSDFDAAVQAFIQASTDHMMGPPGHPAPRSSEWVERVVQRVPQQGNPATRGPDQFVAVPYQIVDDTPKTPEQQKAIDLLRETING